jgi:hypothetical protein
MRATPCAEEPSENRTLEATHRRTPCALFQHVYAATRFPGANSQKSHANHPREAGSSRRTPSHAIPEKFSAPSASARIRNLVGLPDGYALAARDRDDQGLRLRVSHQTFSRAPPTNENRPRRPQALMTPTAVSTAAERVPRSRSAAPRPRPSSARSVRIN